MNNSGSAGTLQSFYRANQVPISIIQKTFCLTYLIFLIKWSMKGTWNPRNCFSVQMTRPKAA
ncbi:hypothetical protein ARMSODRAFT_356672 [Armillaria solidipes]|uniref:Uncharacterized protein n=1 Tax=Armillaria solidipes TaxID=1076256 RepID=A0A2H3BBJ9_9AGAR|nr:hypothetical protein ARMSODRAFT_356672 [Armillaria solidipes]